MTESPGERVILSIEGQVATITLDRPHKLNALYPEMILRFAEHIEAVRRDMGIRALVVRGNGRAFCAGDDLSPEDRFRYGPPDLQNRLRTGYQRLVLDLMELRKPVVALVQGYAVGAGLDLALACDFRIAATGTKLGAVYVKRGLGGGSAYLLPKYVGLGKATELLLLGEYVEMPEALRLGLVTEVVAEDRVEARGYELAKRLSEGPTQAIGAIKIARNQGLGGDPRDGFKAQTWANIELMLHRDARNGPRGFTHRERVRYTGDWINLDDRPATTSKER